MKNFFLSLKTTVWTLFALVCLFFIGSYLMPVHRETFSSMNDDILLNWTRETAADNLFQTWWLFAALAALVLLTVNTLLCSIQAVRGRWSRRDFLLRIAPQVVHVGFLFILLAHLLSAGWGYKISGMLPEGAGAGIPENRQITLDRISVVADDSGYMKDWSAQVSVYDNRKLMGTGVLAPNQPFFYNGIAIYLKSLSFEQGPAAFLLVARDPGAVWALAGGMLFMLGSIALLVLKWKKA